MKTYGKPRVNSERSFDTSALACGKTTDPPPGSFHFSGPYDTFTGHLGAGFGGSESASGTVGPGFGPGGTSSSYHYEGLCGNWITWQS